MCGENLFPRIGAHHVTGSSPRVRGKLAAGEFDCCGLRLIPACAGKTVEPPGDQAPGGAHPRVCGENLSGDQEAMVEAGSSPRVRGKLLELGAEDDREGLIPACAGKTSWKSSTPWPWWAHPRVCGENATAAWSGVQAAGSSPRVRGKRSHDHGPGGPRGLIPACAGKTACALRASRSPPAHPRVCGENERGEEDRGVGLGSSPRVRGKLVAAHRVRAVRGLIPACAGKTTPGGALSTPRGAHPRVCGENIRERAFGHHEAGSSPRVRGKPPATEEVDA